MIKSLAFDLETYPNYFLATFDADGVKHEFELTSEDDSLSNDQCTDIVKLIGDAEEIVTFNGTYYDIPLLRVAIGANKPNAKAIHAESDRIIESKRQVAQDGAFSDRPERHVDLCMLLPQRKGLKLLGANLHSSKIGDLPYPPHQSLTREQMQQVKTYCSNDVAITRDVQNSMRDELTIRNNLDTWMTAHNYDPQEISPVGCHGVTRPQLGERVLLSTTGKRRTAPVWQPSRAYYDPPTWMRFGDPSLTDIFNEYVASNFMVRDDGRLNPPFSVFPFDEKGKIKYDLNGVQCVLGLGGLHTQHTKGEYLERTDSHGIYHYDVTSYYPSLMLTSGKMDTALQRGFQDMLDQRIEAKQAGEKGTADALKIVVNSVFGKTLEPHSTLYNPDMFLYVTATGQFALLMLMEAVQEAGARIVQANTDGVVLQHKHGDQRVAEALEKWQECTSLNLEGMEFQRFGQKDVNNYIGVTLDGNVKAIGTCALNDARQNISFPITRHAVSQFVTDGTPLRTTIENATDLRDFLRVANANRTKEGLERRIFDADTQALGKVVRFYLSTDADESGFKSVPVDTDWQPCGRASRVGLSAGGVALEELPIAKNGKYEIPANLNRDAYIEHAAKALSALGESEHSAQVTYELIDQREGSLGFEF